MSEERLYVSRQSYQNIFSRQVDFRHNTYIQYAIEICIMLLKNVDVSCDAIYVMPHA